MNAVFNILVKVVSKATKVDLGDPNVIDTLHEILHALIG